MKDSHKILLLALAAGVVFWVVDGLVDWLVFYQSTSLLDIALLDIPGHELYMRLVVILVMLAFGSIAARIIERRRRTETALEKNEKLLTNIIDQSPFPMWISDAFGVNIRQNPAFSRMLRLKDDSLTVGLYNLLEDNVLQEQGHLEKLERVFLRAEPISFITDYDIGQVKQLKLPDGPRLQLATTVFPITDDDGRVIHAVVQYEDITGRRKVEDAIRASEQRFRAMFDISRDVIAIIDGRDRVQWSNLTWCEIFGFRPGAPVDWFEKLHPEDLERFTILWQNVQNGIGEVSNLEIRFKASDGRYVLLETTIRRIELDQNECVFFDGYDITLRKRAERNLAEEKERLRVTLQSIAEGVIATNAEGEVMLINSVASRMTGCNAPEDCGKRLEEVLHLYAERDGVVIDSAASILLDLDQAELDRRQWHMKAASGGGMDLEIRSSAITSDKGEQLGKVFVFRDVTETRKMEFELQRADKLDSLGVLAGGIAHDFNNILTSVLGNIELARIYAEGNDKVDESLERAKDSALSAKDLTGRLLTFSKGGAPLKRRQKVASFIQEAVKLALSGSNVGAEFELQDNLWPVDVDIEQFGQAIRNLAVNAVQAMPDGGVVRVTAYNAADEGPEYQSAIVITVADTGRGINKDILPKIFDPFFSTKDKGSGLGLSVCYSVVKRHGGRIDVESVPGKGTLFRIVLPAMPSEEESAAAAPVPRSPGKTRLRVLVVDDEEPVRMLVGKIFNHLGHDCESVADGAAALDEYKQVMGTARCYDLVVLDLTIPGGMGGRETLGELREIDPEVTAIVTSGYADDPILSDFKAHGFRGSLTKPFEIEEVEILVSRLFDSVRNSG